MEKWYLHIFPYLYISSAYTFLESFQVSTFRVFITFEISHVIFFSYVSFINCPLNKQQIDIFFICINNTKCKLKIKNITLHEQHIVQSYQIRRISYIVIFGPPLGKSLSRVLAFLSQVTTFRRLSWRHRVQLPTRQPQNVSLVWAPNLRIWANVS